MAAVIDLKPLPTRIFGIGWHKTGTTSLHHAFETLGFDSVHWPSAHWAKAVWFEMMEGRSRTLERHYALTDMPIAPLYAELDHAYPGSKFILTVRDEVSWLQSAQRHWSWDHNPHRPRWEKDRFTHMLHHNLYGRRDFDALTHLARYRRHNDEVRQYFGSRDDLLVINVDDGWTKLCEFLGQSVPSGPYPAANRSI